MAFARIIGSFESIAFLKVLHLMCVTVAYSAFQVNFTVALLRTQKLRRSGNVSLDSSAFFCLK